MKLLVVAALVAIFTAVTSTGSIASAWPGQEKYPIKSEHGVKFVLFPENMATGILNALKSNATEDQVKAMISSHVFVELAKIDASPTFCTVAGSVYQTPNRNEAETVAKCEDMLQRPSFAKMLLQDPPENLSSITPLEFSEQISKMFALMIQLF
jgi:hypothetical protein